MDDLPALPPELAERGRELVEWLTSAGWVAHPRHEWEGLAADRLTLGRLRARVRAFAADCVEHGDMTPAAQLMLHRILDEEADDDR